MLRAVQGGGYDKSCRERGLWQELYREGAMITAVEERGYDHSRRGKGL